MLFVPLQLIIGAGAVKPNVRAGRIVPASRALVIVDRGKIMTVQARICRNAGIPIWNAQAPRRQPPEGQRKGRAAQQVMA